jgi:hypothetical protein
MSTARAARAPQRVPQRGPVHRSGVRATVPERLPGNERGRPGHLRVVRPDERPRRRLSPAVGVIGTVVLFVLLLALAGAHTLLVQSQIRLDDLSEQVGAEQARYQELRLRVAELESPGRIVSVAQDRIGMVEPEQLVYLTPDAPAPTGPVAPAGPTGATPAELAGDDTWAQIKPLLEAAAP